MYSVVALNSLGYFQIGVSTTAVAYFRSKPRIVLPVKTKIYDWVFVIAGEVSSLRLILDCPTFHILTPTVRTCNRPLYRWIRATYQHLLI